MMLKVDPDDFQEPVTISWKKNYRFQEIPGYKVFWRIEAEHMGQTVTFDAVYSVDEMEKNLQSLPKDLPTHTDWKVYRYEPVFAVYEGAPKE